MSTLRNHSILLKIIALVVLVFLVQPQVLPNISAQESEDNWSIPVNLSSSGATTDPVMVVDSGGIFHITWKDEFAGYIYTTGDGEEWGVPIPVQLPSGDFQPWLAADTNGRVHAFWINDKGELFHSQVNSIDFATNSSWTVAQMLSDSAVDLDVAIGASGQLHLSYVRTLSSTEFPAGLYYQKYLSDSGDWLPPVILYESAYFRTLDNETGHVDVATENPSGVDQVYIVWDNRPRARIFLTKSMDGGETWDSPQEIDKTQVGEGTMVPTNIRVHAEDEKVLLLWNKGSEESDCVSYYQWSEDGGENWQVREQLFGDSTISSLIGCPEDIQILSGEDHLFLLVKSIQVYLVVWDGTRWSDPQNQSALSNFIDQDTQNTVDFACTQAIMKPGNQLSVVGCDTGIGGDIWFMKRQITSIEGWFPVEPVWSSPVQLVESESEIIQPFLTSDAGNQIHAFWSQINSAVSDNLNEVIFYARQEGGRQWTDPKEILRIPEESLRQPSVAVDSSGNLLLVWTGSQSGKIYFSAAPANQAVLPTAWSNPVALPSPQSPASSPDIHIAPDGTIFVVYAVPLNQDRGIYLVQSGDGGSTWSNPMLIFDAVSTGWAMVDRPLLAITRDTHLHIIWTEYSLPSGPGPLALYYVRSEDKGVSWSEPEQVIKKPVPWSGIIGITDQSLHRIWQEVGSGGITLWHDYSTDDGITWTRISPVSIFNEKVSSSGLVVDRAGRLNLLQVVNRGGGSFDLQHWVWDEQNWKSEASLVFEKAVTANVDHLAAALSEDGELGVIFMSDEIDVVTGEKLETLSFTQRTLEISTDGSPEVVDTSLPATQITPQTTPTLAPTPTATATPEGTSLAALQSATVGPTSGPTTTPDFGESTPINTGGILGTSGVNLIIGTLIVVLVVALATGAWFYRRKRVNL